jgi:hypothetical protein
MDTSKLLFVTGGHPIRRMAISLIRYILKN